MSACIENIFSEIPPFPEYLRDIRELALKTVADPEHLPSVRVALDAAMGTILAELNAPIPSARWVLHEYVGDFVDGDVVEHTRPAMFKVQDYWDQVNG